MAVYTKLSQAEMADLIADFFNGPLIHFDGAADGMENTTYFVTAEHAGKPQDYVLTVVETLSFEQLPFIVELTTQLNAKGLPIPCPLQDKSGQALKHIAGKPALLFPKVIGSHQLAVNQQQCFAIGELLGQMHLTTLNSSGPANPRDLNWCYAQLERFQNKLSTVDTQLLSRALEVCKQFEALPATLPKAAIHGDVFRDNVLFANNEVVAVIDFFMACEDHLLLDLATTVNDWCSTPGGDLDDVLYSALLKGYQKHRTLNASEKSHWPLFLQFSAFRFWVGRLAYEFDGLHNPEKAAAIYRDILSKRLEQGPTLCL